MERVPDLQEAIAMERVPDLQEAMTAMEGVPDLQEAIAMEPVSDLQFWMTNMEGVPVPETFQVFISHRGPDVKTTLASLIYHRLTSCGLSVFLDKGELRMGETLSHAIGTAILAASIHIVILSPRYAESTWCLEELYWILRLRSSHKRHTKIVFFNVKPTDPRYIKRGCYAKAFENHRSKGRVPIEDIDKWEIALNEASHISGLVFKTKESDDGSHISSQPVKTEESDWGECLEKIVKEVVEEVFKLGPLDVAKYPVGLHQAAEDFETEIMKQRDSIVVGIAGMVGVGKSTLARYLYELKRSGFTRSCFLCDVRKRDLLSLQKELLSGLVGHQFDHIGDIYRGKKSLRDCLRHQKTLVVLDDVDDMKQIDGLLDTNYVHSESLILITSSDKDLLRRSSAKTTVYDVKPLHEKHARKLFCRHAFAETKPSDEFEGLVDEILKICEGLPLSLKVLGGLFLGQSVEFWKRKLEEICTTLPYDIINPFKVRYEALGRVEKQVFLDIGCFLVGEEQELAIQVLEGLYENNRIGGYLEGLLQKCLVDVHRDGYGSVKITMHSQLRELARHIARKEFRVFPAPPRLRISCSDDIQELLQSQAGSDFRIRGIRFSKGQGRQYSIRGIRVEEMRLLVIEDFEGLWPDWDVSGDLLWLRLRRIEPFFFPRSISLRRLRVLEIEGRGEWVEALFDKFFHDLPTDLNELNIDLTDFDYLSGFDFLMPWRPSIFRFLKVTGVRTLTKLVLKNLSFLQSIPIEFSQFENLRHLDLSGSRNLKELPNTFSQLLQLQYLSLRGCVSLSIPPDILGEISTLEYVDFKGCRNLLALPLGIPYQRHLRYLSFLDTGLLQLPDNLELLDHLKQLEIGSPALTELPLPVSHLRGLKILILSECSGLRCILPEKIGAPNIKILAINNCPIGNFIFQDQESVLRDFTLKCTSVSEICIPEGVLPRLETVDLSRNSLLMKVNALPSALVKLNLSFCPKLKTLTTLSNLANLKLLDVSNCFELDTLNVGGLMSLQEIKAKECWKLKWIKGLSQCGRLNGLNISTDTRIIWNDICKFLTSPYRGKLSTASISGLADVKTISDEEEVRCILRRFTRKMGNMVSTTKRSDDFSVKLGDFHSLSAILVFFTSNAARIYPENMVYLSVEFMLDTWYYGGLHFQYITKRGEVGGRRLHIILWTEDSELFRDNKEHSTIDVRGHYEEGLEWGQIVGVDKGEDVLEVCKEIITAFA